MFSKKQGDGMEGPPDEEVKQVQRGINAHGPGKVAVDGRFGPVTHEAVKAFQKRAGLNANGVVDANAYEVMLNPPPLSREQVVAQEKKDAAKAAPKGRSSGGRSSSGGSRSRATSTARSRGAASGTTVRDGSILRQGEGMKGKPSSKVKAMQDMLQSLGYDLGDGGTDGRFGPDTRAAMKAFQDDHGLEPDGVVGLKTRRLVNRLNSRLKSEQTAVHTGKAPKDDYKLVEGDMTTTKPSPGTDQFPPIPERALQEAADSMAKASSPEPFSKSKTSNWVAKRGGLPAYVQHIAHDLMEKRGKSESNAIQMAIGIVKRWCRGGGKVDANTKAAACKAAAEWEKMKGANKASKLAECVFNVEEAVANRVAAAKVGGKEFARAQAHERYHRRKLQEAEADVTLDWTAILEGLNPGSRLDFMSAQVIKQADGRGFQVAVVDPDGDDWDHFFYPNAGAAAGKLREALGAPVEEDDFVNVGDNR
jgi:peptidoglycan hydrolase-like protein with peptidoglycan-binding domain